MLSLAQKTKNENELYRKYITKLKGFFFKETRSKELSEELSLEAITKVMLSMDNYNTNVPLERWVYVIARNHLVDYYRKNGSCKSQFNRNLLDITAKHITESHYLAHESFDDNLVIDNIKVHLTTFDKTSQKIFNLSVFEGKGDEEIAQLIGIKTTTVKHRMAMVKRELRKMCDTGKF
jgi:RNA polymerase sigma-70 factor, ECF subfamily